MAQAGMSSSRARGGPRLSGCASLLGIGAKGKGKSAGEEGVLTTLGGNAWSAETRRVHLENMSGSRHWAEACVSRLGEQSAIIAVGRL